MKNKYFLFLVIFLCSISLYAQTNETIKFYQIDGNTKPYKLADIQRLTVIKTNPPFKMKLYYQDSLNVTFLMSDIDSLKFENVKNFISNLVIFQTGSTVKKYALADIDSIIIIAPVIPLPQISSIKPTTVKIGDEIDIYGINFGAAQGTSFVSFSAVNATNFISWSDTLIKVKTPAGAANGKLSVTVNSKKSNEADYTIFVIPVPKLISIKPVASNIGDLVTITGTALGVTLGSSILNFGNIKATEITSWNDTVIKAKVPIGASTGKLSVIVNSIKSNELDFTIIGTIALTIDNISPATGYVGDNVTLTGVGYGATRGTNYVTFSSATVSTYTSWSETEIKLKVPIGTKTSKVTVNVGGKQSNQVDFGIIPKITKLAPDSAGKSEYISIIGSGFGDLQGASTVSIAGVIPTAFESWSDTLIVVRIPQTAVSGKIFVTVTDLKSNEVDFTVVQFIQAITPSFASIGDDVVISGTDFGATQGTSLVSFNSLKVTVYKSWSDTEIKLLVPAGVISGKVSVTIGKRKSNLVDFAVVPKIASINPASAKISDAVTITGTGFGDVQGAGIVSFNNAEATEYQSWSSTSIVVKVPSGARNGKVSVTASSHKSNEVDFVILPSISVIYPTYGLVGDQIAITGISFGATQGTSYVSFSGANATDYPGWSDNNISVTIPTGANTGKLSVTVGGIKSNEVDFVLSPHITGITPNSSALGGTVTISGANFGSTRGTSNVTFNTADASDFVSWSNTSIVLKVPQGAKTGKVYVTKSNVKSNEVDYTVTTIVIGTQEWMVNNLDVATYNNGDAIPQVTDGSTWSSLTTGAWCYYNNDQANGATLGRLYNWYAVHDPRGIAPTGWHVATNSDWTTLSDYLGGLTVAGGKLKESGTSHWTSPNTGATNETGFTALPGGYRIGSGFGRINDAGTWWTSTTVDADNAWSIYMWYNSGALSNFGNYKATGFSVRCVKD